MRLPKFLSSLVFITLFALLYVYQQTEIFHLAYTGQKNTACFKDLLDKNAILRYNIQRNASLIRVGTKFSEFVDFQMPDAYRLVRLTIPKEGLRLSARSPKRENIVSRIFEIKRQAEAKTISLSNTLGADGD